MERCTWRILHHDQQKVHLKKSDFGVLNHKFLLVAVAVTSRVCAWLFALRLTGTTERRLRCCFSSQRSREV